MSNTVVIQIGNSDNKLTQQEWAEFIGRIRKAINAYCGHRHFDGGFDRPWQNACFVAEITPECMEPLLSEIAIVRQRFRQDSVAVVFGETQFV